MKICSSCKVAKELSAFYKNKSMKDGLSNQCIDCAKIYRFLHKDELSAYDKAYNIKYKKEKSDYDKIYQAEHREKKNEQSRNWAINHQIEKREYHFEYYKNNRESLLARDKIYKAGQRPLLKNRLIAVKNRAKSTKRDYDLTIEWAESLPMMCFYTKRELTLEPHKINTVSFDRKDNNKGYTKDNVVLCCHFVNKAKNILSINEFKSLIKDMYLNMNNF